MVPQTGLGLMSLSLQGLPLHVSIQSLLLPLLMLHLEYKWRTIRQLKI